MDESMATMQIKRQILREIRNETWHIEILLFIKQLFQINHDDNVFILRYDTGRRRAHAGKAI